MRSIRGGAIQLAKVVTDAELATAAYRLQKRTAIPVHGFSTASRPIKGGPVQPVYLVSQAQLDSGLFILTGGPAIPMGNVAVVGGEGRAVNGRIALPVFVTSGDMAAAGVQVLIVDPFTDTNGTSLADHVPPTNIPGNAWVRAAGTTTIQSNAALCASGDRNVISAGTADVIMTITVNPAAGANSLIMFRYVNTSSYWFVQLREPNNDFRLIRFDGSNNLVDTASVTITGGVSYTVVITLSGNSIAATLDGANDLAGSSTYNNTAVSHGMGSAGASTSFDNLNITSN